jgi:formylglycine-generating enzyme required for sulfatase activity
MTSSPKLMIKHRQAEAPCFVERLGESVSMKLMLIPGGKFEMGSPTDEAERLDRERPVHSVTIPRFFMGKYPVTQAQWRAIASFPNVNRNLNPDPSHFKGDTRPVERVSWYDAMEWCDRLSRQTGREYRLPTEAEWEYACRAGTTTPFHFGEIITAELANYQATGTYGQGTPREYREETTPVDHFRVANAFGLCEMHGNVWEWCLDHWHENYEGAPDDGSAWLTMNKRTRRVLRGGSWDYHPRNCRSASRHFNDPVIRDYVIGFRVVCEVPRILQ